MALITLVILNTGKELFKYGAEFLFNEAELILLFPYELQGKQQKTVCVWKKLVETLLLL